MTDPMELAARAMIPVYTKHGDTREDYNDCLRDTIFPELAQACVTAFLTAALADPATVERVARALCEDHDVNWAKYPALFTEDALTALSAIKALANE